MKRIIFVLVTVIVLGTSFFTNSWAALPVASRAVSKPATNIKPAVTASPKPVAATPAPSPSPSPSPTPVTAVPVKKTPAPIPGNSLSIPAIGVMTPIVEVGTTPQNTIGSPSGAQAGHWDKSAVPGSPGAVFLDGHLVSGAFVKLNQLVVGQTVTVRYNNQTYNYRVVHTEIVPLDGIDMNRALSVYGGASEGLNMMTCAGKYILSAGTYDHRLTVYTVRV